VEPRFYDPFSDDIVNVQNIVLLVLLGQSSGCLRCHKGLHGGWGCGRTPPTLYLDNPPPSCSEPEDRTHPFLLWSHRRGRTNELPQNRSLRHFVLYSHTFLTRLGESGCDAWTLARIAGHSSVPMSSRYVHPSEDAVLAALDRLSGHNFGHSGNGGEKRLTVEPLLSTSNDSSKDGRGERI
jgi:hypothetical protein